MKLILIGLVLAAGWVAPGHSQSTIATTDFTRALLIPPILENTSARSGQVILNLTAQKGRTELLAGKPTESLGFNGDYLGPTIRVRRGDQVRINVENALGEDTTVHWHGLHVPGEMDGGPRQVIDAGTTWRPEFTINQEAATLWYHPHLLGKTAEHVYRGMAGLFIIDDERSDRLALPRDYGVDDIPLVLQDRRLSADGRLTYRPRMPDIMHGLHGNVMLVNGVHRPFVRVPAGLVRLRVLNGSNSTIHRVSLDDDSAFHQIASDGGFLEAPVELTYLVLSPGERAEILVDFGTYGAGASLTLVSEIFQGEVFQALQFRVGDSADRKFAVPERLNRITRFQESDTDKTRRFVLSTMGRGGQLTINGKHMDMKRIDERVKLGDLEIWELTNQGMGMGMMEQIPHSMHLHDVQFQVLSIDGDPPPPHLMGWKDTVLIWPGETVRIAARFEDYTGIYMYHCHFLEHEEAGMMGQFEVAR